MNQNVQWMVVYLDSRGRTIIHDYKPVRKEEALLVGDELTRDHVAQFFRVQRCK